MAIQFNNNSGVLISGINSGTHVTISADEATGKLTATPVVIPSSTGYTGQINTKVLLHNLEDSLLNGALLIEPTLPEVAVSYEVLNTRPSDRNAHDFIMNASVANIEDSSQYIKHAPINGSITSFINILNYLDDSKFPENTTINIGINDNDKFNHIPYEFKKGENKVIRMTYTYINDEGNEIIEPTDITINANNEGYLNLSNIIDIKVKTFKNPSPLF